MRTCLPAAPTMATLLRNQPSNLLAIILGALSAAPLSAQVSLRALPELARQRAERLRPKQIAALEPFWANLSLEYRINQQILDQQIEAAAQLGDSVVPMLLEKLQPAQSGATARHLAENCRRVLERLDPASFVDALAELAKGEHDVARSQAIRLLGHADVQQSVRVLTDLLDQTAPDDRRLVVRALHRLRARSAAPKVVTLLGSSDRSVREDVLAYLIAARADAVSDTVVAALGNETDDRLLPFYIDYFASCVRADVAATRALLPLLDRERLDYQDRKNLVKALADVAPADDEPTLRKLHELIDGTDTSSLVVQAAVSLRKLGDKQGATRLKRSLDDKIRRRKREPSLYEQRANLLFEIEEYADAIDDYEKVLEFTDGIAMTRLAYIGLIRSEARRRKIQNMVKYLKAANMSVLEIEALGNNDEAVASALEHDRAQTFLRALAREQAPK